VNRVKKVAKQIFLLKFLRNKVRMFRSRNTEKVFTKIFRENK